ncbi:MAG TPA: protein kinase [Vicinamibacterales bacterium]|nr:protein kinase [Vicinamibacterales bacterium]
MPIEAGTRLGPYEIVAPLGAGGMGEVYRARDARLGRDVAIKVLPTAVASDPDRRARFEREAQLLASLNHPSIAAIHGIEDSGGLTALVLELVDGPTLAERIPGVGLDDSLAIALQIVDALEAAHERGIVHRDLKPANVKVRPDGTVKVLDFGLAKMIEPVATDSHAMSSPTLTSPAGMTRAGVIIGTAAYMAPEQARGRPADRRADIWAFGCVLFEMLTGRLAFPGDDVAECVAAVMRGEPDWTLLPPSTPPAVVRLLHRCLKKDPRERLRDIGDARFELADSDVAASSSLRRAAARPRAIEWIAAAAIGAVIAAAALWPRLQKPAAPTEVRMDIVVPGDEQVASVAVARDGRSVAFVTVKGSRSVLWTRSIGDGVRQRVDGADGAELPFWSPDGRSIGFFQNRWLKIVAAGGGPVQSLCEAPTGRGASWNTDGTIVFNSVNQGPLFRVAASGGPCTQLTTVDRAQHEESHRFPYWLPDGTHFLYLAYKAGATDEVYVSSLKGPAVRVLTNAGNTSYVDDGFLTFVRGGTLMAQRFDLQTLRTSGDPMRLTPENPLSSSGTRYAPVSAASGTVAWVPDTTRRSRLVFVDRGGREVAGVAEAGFFSNVSLSRDGTKAAVIRGEGTEADVWIADRRGQLTRLTPRTGSYSAVQLSPDAKTVAYSFNPGTGFNVFLRPADGSGDEREILHSALWQHPTGWSTDGRLMLYEVADPKTSLDIWYAAVDGSTPPAPLLQSTFVESSGRLSPDDKWVAYTSDETGQPEVYVRAFPSGRDKRKVSSGGFRAPRWAQSGRELFMSTQSGVAVASIAASASGLEIGPVTMLFERAIRAFDVAGSGAEFLINALEPAPPSRIVVSIDWSPAR